MDREEFQPGWFSFPGETLESVVQRRSMSIPDLARSLGCGTDFIDGLICGKSAIDQEIAGKLEVSLGGTAAFWVARQRQFDEALDRLTDSVPEIEARNWLQTLPVQKMVDRNWIARPNQTRDAIRSCLSFFDVSSPDEWRERYTNFANSFSFRSSPTYISKIGALSVWLRQGELQARRIYTKDWDRERFRRQLGLIRALIKVKEPAYFIPRLRALCAEAGVAVAFVDAPQGCRASGAARFVTQRKALIILSLRYKSDDHFWFTFFHEAGHLLLDEGKRTFVDEDGQHQSDVETAANQFSAAMLIPAERFDDLMNLKAQARSIIRFAVSIEVSPGVVVGQMQHLKLIGPNKFNHLKRRFNTDAIFDTIA